MKENIQYMGEKKVGGWGSEWMQHFPKSWFIPTEKTNSQIFQKLKSL